MDHTADVPAAADRQPREHELALAAAELRVLGSAVVRLLLRESLHVRHGDGLPQSRSTARCSSALVILDRPLIRLARASSYSCDFVRPPGPEWERSPPRRPDEMSVTEARLASRASPERARSLFTVRAAISSAVSSLRPCSFRPCLMCSYCRSRFALQASWGIGCSFHPGRLGSGPNPVPTRSGANSPGIGTPRLGPPRGRLEGVGERDGRRARWSPITPR